MKIFLKLYPIAALVSLSLIIVFFTPVVRAEAEKVSAKDDYMTCWKQPCVRVAGSEWSEGCHKGVGVSVRMGTESALSDDEIKQMIVGDLRFYKVKDMRFFYEKFKGKSTAIALHVRGGAEGTFFVDEVRGELKAIAKRALNTNPLFTPEKAASKDCSYR
ncbi:MAG: hypothetical protein ACI9SP_004374 [Arenicella sp.]